MSLPISTPSATNTLETLFSLPESCRGEQEGIRTRVQLARLTSAAGTSSLSSNGVNVGRIFVRMGEKSIQGVNQEQRIDLVPVGLGDTQ